MRRTAALVFGLWIALGATAQLAFAQGAELPAEPDAVLSLRSRQAAVGIGFSWGSGVLSFRGRDYPVRVTGLSAGAVGIVRADARGQVYSLPKVDDFNGTYTAYTVGSTIGGGGSVATMRNQNGVVIRVVSTTQGLNLTLSASGVSMRIQGESTPTPAAPGAPPAPPAP
jgi:hypothetical protein